jgi:prepilin-type processing-associated H-X9-DG protein
LPYLEQSTVSSQIRFDKDITDPLNASIRTHSLRVFLCPSDAGEAIFTVNKLNDSTPTYSTPLTGVNGQPVQVARSNYVGIFGKPEITPDPGFLLTADPRRAVAHQGIFYRNSRVRLADVTDGTSTTLCAGERSSNLACATWTGSVTGGQVPPKSPNPLGYGPEGAPVLILGHTGDASDMPAHTPNSPVNHVDDFWSQHIHGVNFLFMDGSVRSMGNSTTPSVWWAVGTRAGGEAIALDD